MEILSLNDASITLTNLIMPYMTAIIAVVIAIWFKDLATSIAKGIAFLSNRNFKEGDKVLVDGENAIIVKIGLFQTVFGILKPDETYCWRYVPNERIPYLKIEKVIHEQHKEVKDD